MKGQDHGKTSDTAQRNPHQCTTAQQPALKQPALKQPPSRPLQVYRLGQHLTGFALCAEPGSIITMSTPDIDPVSTIRNLGPASEEGFARAGLTTAQQVRDLGADEAYRRLLAAGTVPHFIGYYALVLGLQGRPWNDAKGEEKSARRVRFDAIRSAIVPSESGIDKALAEIGVIPKSRRRSA